MQTRFGVLVITLLCLCAGAPHLSSAMEPNFLRLSLESEPTTLDWNRVRSGSSRFIISFLMRGLLKYDSNAALVCDLCKSFQTSPDRRTFMFKINTDEVWSDGVHLQAQHFVDSFRRLLDPALNSPAAEDFRVITGAPESTTAAKSKHWDPRKLGVKAVGNDTLEITLSKPLAVFSHLLTTVATFPIRKEFLKAKDTGENHATSAVLGPYYLAEWVPGKWIVIEGNLKYQGSRPVSRVQFILGTHSQLATKFQKGKLEILSHPTNEDLMKTANRNVQVNPFWATRNLLLNTKKKPISELAFRRALLYSLDRASLPSFLKSGERPVTGLIPKGLPGYRELPLATLDLARAQSEKARAVPASQTVPLRLILMDTENERRIGQWVAEQLKRIQVQVTSEPLKSKAFEAALNAGNFDLALMNWEFGIASPLEVLQAFQTHSKLNYGHFTNVAYDSLVEQMLLDPKPSDVAGLVDQSSQILEIQEVGAIPLGYPTQSFLLSDRVQNFATTSFGDPDLVKIALKPAGGKRTLAPR